MYRVVFLVVLSFLAACSQVAPPKAGADIDTQLAASGVKGDGEQIAVSQKLGAVFVVGNTTGALDGEYKGLTDVFLRRYNRDGTIAWRRQIGGDADDRAGGVAVDQNNNVYVGTTKCKTGSPCSGNLYKYDSKGNQLWVRRYLDLAGEYEFNRDVYSESVGVDSSNNVYVTGLTTDSTDFYVRKYGSDGTLKYFKRFDIPYFRGDALTAATTDRNGNSYVNVYESSYGEGVDRSYLYKISADGDVLWNRLLEQGFTVFLFSDLEVVGDALYGSGEKRYYYYYDVDTYIADYDAYVAKYTLNGEKLWGKTIGTSKPERGDGVSADAQGNVYVTGRAVDSYRYGEQGYAFIQKHTANGSVVWKKQFGSETKGVLADIAAYSPTEIYATGRSDNSFPGGTRNSGVLTLRVDGSGKTVWLDQ